MSVKIRWRIEHDYDELKDGLGLDHFEGRSWAGWNRHVTLVNTAQFGCWLEVYSPKLIAVSAEQEVADYLGSREEVLGRLQYETGRTLPEP